MSTFLRRFHAPFVADPPVSPAHQRPQRLRFHGRLLAQAAPQQRFRRMIVGQQQDTGLQALDEQTKKRGYISLAAFNKVSELNAKSSYGEYLKTVARSFNA